MRLILFLLFTTSCLFAESVVELTLIDHDRGFSINYYDSPNKVLESLGSESNFLSEGQTRGWFTNKGDGFELKTLVLPSKYPIRGKTISLYEIHYLKITKRFRTFRDIGIGSSVKEVAMAYPNAIFYIPGEKYWQDEFWTFEDGKATPKGLTAAIYWDFGTSKRPADLSGDLEYGFSFRFNDSGYVNEIEMGNIVTEK
ncbi:hypothetical protein EXM22_04200 [Oceanispirochaeta crateris]|uniref:Uncharacterized protein n=1 Tax=Oceanispirochaeta crateris TaxID=2518645 RepID=A0A5C1QI79_9SPIO|nr:hypothetical protein [Oceanispirochaeta crateris]QEN07227.1 hypothetical protein EXM22_04200 [Oceanispirochaeta crateris]